jgi:hypothetical protein
MLVVGAAFPAREVVGSIFCACNAKKTKRISYSVYFEKLKNIETRLHGFLHNCARPKRVCKKTSETSIRQSSLGGV